MALKQDGTVVVWSGNEHGQNNLPPNLAGVTAIAAGSNHTLALKQDGTVAAWGENSIGQTDVPSGLTNVVSIAAGGISSAAVKAGGSVVTWGYHNTIAMPAEIANITSLALGGSHTLALKRDSSIIAWGNYSSGETDVPNSLTGLTAIAAGWSHTLGLRQDGTVIAWGTDDYGETVVPPGLKDVIAISAGGDVSLALKRDGTVVAWGYNGGAWTGLSGVTAIASGVFHHVALRANGTIAMRGNSAPAGLTGISAIAAGCNHTVVAKADGSVVAFGRNDYGQATVPEGLTGVTAVAAGLFHSVALKQDGTVIAWGFNGGGQCNVPGDLTGVVAIAAGEHFTIALKQDGTPVGWGEPWEGQIRIPRGLPPITAISAGGDASFLRTSLDNGPQIFQVGPGPISGSNAKQPVTISGSGFHPDCRVTLRDHRTGEVFPDRPKVSQSPTAIGLSVNFTTMPAEWSVEVENPDGQISGRFRFQVGQPVIPGQTVDRLVVTGPPSVPSNGSAPLTATLYYRNGTQLDVSDSAVFSPAGGFPEGVVLRGNELTVNKYASGTVRVKAAVSGDLGGIGSAPSEPIAIGSGFRAEISRYYPESSSNPFTIHVMAWASEVGTNHTCSWDFNGDGIYNDGPNLLHATYTYPSIAGTKTVRFRIVNNATQQQANAEADIDLAKVAAFNQPVTPKPVTIWGLGNFYDIWGDGDDAFGFRTERVSNGLIVLTHGMKNSGRA